MRRNDKDLWILFKSVYFCDWTEEGTLLGNASEDGRTWSVAGHAHVKRHLGICKTR